MSASAAPTSWAVIGSMEKGSRRSQLPASRPTVRFNLAMQRCGIDRQTCSGPTVKPTRRRRSGATNRDMVSQNSQIPRLRRRICPIPSPGDAYPGGRRDLRSLVWWPFPGFGLVVCRTRTSGQGGQENTGKRHLYGATAACWRGSSGSIPAGPSRIDRTNQATVRDAGEPGDPAADGSWWRSRGAVGSGATAHQRKRKHDVSKRLHPLTPARQLRLG